MSFLKFRVFLLLVFATAPGLALANNLHLIDEDSQTGYQIYRSGKPSRADFKEICNAGITRMIVLSGDADKVENKYAADCPKLEVIYNNRQSVKTPLTSTFLHQFDEWVRDAHEKGIKIAFRCDCGCHRTGRLAAYYNMKYKSMDAETAIRDMKKLGKFMIFYPSLPPQVRALKDFMDGKSCSQESERCVDYVLGSDDYA
ncbi:MAG: dual specificity protein phosphatase family protein [Cryobacterium sp.]|nr:dual specificity protein phosphatase family protein [Oligoflexia bacterium]